MHEGPLQIVYIVRILSTTRLKRLYSNPTTRIMFYKGQPLLCLGNIFRSFYCGAVSRQKITMSLFFLNNEHKRGIWRGKEGNNRQGSRWGIFAR